MIVLLLAFQAPTSSPPLPPYKRQETVGVYASSYDPAVAVAGNAFYTVNGEDCLAYRLPTLKKLWRTKTPNEERAEAVVCSGSILYVTTSPAYRKSNSSLLCLDAISGKLKWRVPRTGEGSPISLGGGRLFLSMKAHSLSAVDPKTRKAVWSTTLGAARPDERGEAPETISANGDYVLTNLGSITYCLNSKNGKILWSESKSYMFHGLIPITGGVAWVPSNNGSVGRELKTGKVLWRKDKESASEFGGVKSGLFVGIDSGMVFAVQPKSGKIEWSHLLGSPGTSGGNQHGAILGKLIYAKGIDKAAIVTPDGKAIWKGAEDEALPWPCWTDGKTVVCFDSQSLMRYVHGEAETLPKDPAARRVLAEKMVAAYDKIDSAELKRLESLGDDAFEPVLKAFLAACRAHDLAGEKKDSYPLYSKYQDLGRTLMKVTTARRSNELLEALKNEKPNSSAKPLLLTLLAQFGDPSIVTPFFLKEIEGGKTPGFEMYESNTYVAREYLVRSKDPRAVAFMIRQLKDPKADQTLRYEAYVHLAGTGGEEGLQAVLAERNKRRLLRPLKERAVEGFLGAGEFGKKMKALAEKKDPQGREWGLLQSGVLGSHGDLWLAEKAGGVWTNPLFAGVSTEGISRWAKPPPPETTLAGKTAKQLAEGAWFATLVGNPELAKDSDGDGYTDFAEARLGTDPKIKDTDGDGDPDGLDPWPNAAARPESEAQRVLEAAFEARYHFNDSEGPGLFFAPSDMKPFELIGRRGPMMWVSVKGRHDWSLPLEQCYEQGVAFIQFSGGREAKPWEEQLIQWNKDRTEATVRISTYFGGLNGTGYLGMIRKFGPEWVAVEMRMEYVS